MAGAGVEVLAVGDELLLGDVVDTNTAALARLLSPAGLAVTRSAAVRDDVGEIRAALAEAVARRPRAVLVGGGLGPTSDDLTRDALAALAGVPLRRDPAVEARLREWYAERGRALSAVAARQADVPAGARVVPNRTGSAPGLALVVDGVPVYALPGVPRELEVMVGEQVLPEVAEPGRAPVLRTVRVAGLGEADVAGLLAPLEADPPAGVRLAYLAGAGEVRVRLSARGPGAPRSVDAAVGRARELLGPAVLGLDDDTLERVVHRLLRASGATLAVAESLTGGLLGAALTGVPGSSDTFLGGVVAYATPLKERLLGVDAALLAARGPVDAGVAAQMAQGVRDLLGASHGLATTGVAGPGARDGHPAGTVHLAVAGRRGVRIASPLLPGEREGVRARAVFAALDLLRRELTEDEP